MRISYAEAVRRGKVNGSTAQRHNASYPERCIYGDETRPWRLHSPAAAATGRDGARRREPASSAAQAWVPVATDRAGTRRQEPPSGVAQAWVPVTRRRQHSRRAPPEQPRQDGGRRRGNDRRYRAPSTQPTTGALRAFIQATIGRCFKCLASDHHAAACRDPVRCFRCHRSGHRQRHCRATRLSTSQRPPAAGHPYPPTRQRPRPQQLNHQRPPPPPPPPLSSRRQPPRTAHQPWQLVTPTQGRR